MRTRYELLSPNLVLPLGRFKMEIGIKLRQAMLLDGILYNSDVWHNISETEIRIIETVDEYLLRV